MSISSIIIICGCHHQLECTITGFPLPIFTHFKTVKQNVDIFFSLFCKKSVIFQPYYGYIRNHVLFCYCLFLWPFISALILEGNQEFSKVVVIQREININPQSMLPGLFPRIIMLSSPWVSEARFWVSNWSTAEMRQKSATVKFVCWFKKWYRTVLKKDSDAMSDMILISVELKWEQQKPGELVLR